MTKEKTETFRCIQCGTEFILCGQRLSQYKSGRKQHQYNGPFCSKRCAAVWQWKYSTGTANQKAHS